MSLSAPNFDSMLDDSRSLRDPTPEEEDRRAEQEWKRSDEGQSLLELDLQIDALAATERDEVRS